MCIEEAYRKISPIFSFWVKIFEYDIRKAESQLIPFSSKNILIISPPTDPGLRLVAEKYQTTFLTFSEILLHRAQEYLSNEKNLNIEYLLYSENLASKHKGKFDVVIANCVFDFCTDHEKKLLINLISSILKSSGSFYAVHMSFPHSILNRIWVFLFKSAPVLRGFCHPVDLASELKEKFQIMQDEKTQKYGFPMQFIIAQKSENQILKTGNP